MAAGDEGEFRVLVNDYPILIKGANWVPLDALHSRDTERLQTAHDLLQETGSNIVRCWGGNVYEDHAFFDLCDARGILVWQDFSMACCLYPQTPDFLATIGEEAAFIIKKLRNHASILLWAGDNEVDEKYSDLNFATEENRYNALTRETLPRAVRMHDPYIDKGIARYDVPEQHNWGDRAYFKDPFYRDSKAHFISECGYFGCPCKESLLKHIPEKELWPFEGSPSWFAHSTEYSPEGPRPNSRTHLMLNQSRLLFGRFPDTIDEFIQMSQVSQAEAKKFFIERTRVKKWRRTGIIFWNLLDGWPQASEALVDYYFQKKRVFAYVQRLLAPVCVMFDELSQWEYRVVLGNDSRKDYNVSYEVVCFETGETVLKGERLSRANENIVVGSIRDNPTRQCLYLIRYTVDGKLFGNHYIAGFPPYELEKMKAWLKEIDALPFNG
jgi:beta-mannosidase